MLMMCVNQGLPISTIDGDLWEHLYKALCAKGLGSFKAKWVKGHATDHHVEDGLISALDWTGNHRADASTDIGNQMHGKDVLAIMQASTSRFMAYVAFMYKVAHHIIEAYKISRVLTDHGNSVKTNREEGVAKSIPYISLFTPPLLVRRSSSPSPLSIAMADSWTPNRGPAISRNLL